MFSILIYLSHFDIGQWSYAFLNTRCTVVWQSVRSLFHSRLVNAKHKLGKTELRKGKMEHRQVKVQYFGN